MSSKDDAPQNMIALYAAAGMRQHLLHALSELIRGSLKRVMREYFNETIIESDRKHRITGGDPDYAALVTYRDEDSAHFWERFLGPERYIATIEEQYEGVWALIRRVIDRILESLERLEREGVLPPPPQSAESWRPLTEESIKWVLGPPR